MKRIFALVSAALVVAPAAAQTAPAPAPVAVPDPLASYVVATGTVDGPKGKIQLQLLISGDNAAMRGLLPGETQWRYMTLSADPDAALRLLADRRVAFLWTPLLAWTGADFGLMRQRMVAHAEKAYAVAAPRASENSADSVVRAPTRALLQLANVLARAGYADRALALLDEDRARRTLRSDQDMSEWVIVTVRKANVLIGLGRYDEAIALLAEARDRIGADNVFAVNLDINRAAALANLGRSADALALITEARARFDRGAVKRRGSVKLDGSDRQFEWIRGCALDGLGRHDEARSAFATVLGAPEPADPFFKTESNDDLRFRIYTCTRDSRALADTIAADATEAVLAPGAFLVMQPRWGTSNDPGGTIAAARADPAARFAVAQWMRDLPPALIPALNRWR